MRIFIIILIKYFVVYCYMFNLVSLDNWFGVCGLKGNVVFLSVNLIFLVFGDFSIKFVI